MSLYKLGRRFINVKREQQFRQLLSNFLPVRHRSCAENIYHCCVWKTASQWVRNVFSQSEVYRHSGLLPFHYESRTPDGIDPRPILERSFDDLFPRRTVVTPLYVSWPNYAAIPKPSSYRSFFVIRDPRDIVVSHYFSTRYSHRHTKRVAAERQNMDGLDDQAGLRYQLEAMEREGIFPAIRSWLANDDANCLVVRFEELVGPDQLNQVMRLLDHCDVRTPESAVRQILARLSFDKLSGGRKPGQEDTRHKYRSGQPGDWKKYFDDDLTDRFRRVGGDLLDGFGYA